MFAIVIKSITLVSPTPPPNKPLVGLEHPPLLSVAVVVSPKSTVLPTEDIVIKSIVLVLAGFSSYPKEKIPLVLLESPVQP